MRTELLADGLISPDDVELLHTTDDPAEAVRIIVECYEEHCATPSPAEAREGRRAVAQSFQARASFETRKRETSSYRPPWFANST